jgi:hypothetical protein
MLYAPQQEPFAHSKISFQKRGTADKAVTPDEDIV